MTETLSHCPLCGHDKFTKVMDCPDHFLSKEVFAIHECQQCKLRFTNPRPDENSIINYYKSDSYISHSNKSSSFKDLIYKMVRKITLKQKLQMIKRFTFQGKLLDYGCGTGHFLDYAHSKGWQVQGVEPDETARQNLPSTLANKVVADLDSIKDEDFNVITLFHVLEHVHQLDSTLKSLIQKLNANGVLILALPNHQSHDAQHYGEYWAGYDVPRHLYHFNQRSLFHLSRKYGLNIVSTIPMKFDSYYVSMLSEQYLGHGNTFMRGLIRGYKSNRKANKTKEYSSLIYVLTR